MSSVDNEGPERQPGRMGHPSACVVDVPVVETERLILRGHRLDDFASLAAMWADPDVTRFIARAPATAEEAWARLLRYAGHWAMMGYGYWAVEEKAAGRYIADVGFADYRRAIVPALDAPEIGWVLAASVAGRGYATEAVRAALAWSDRNLAARTTCIIAPDHAASLNVARKVGYRPEGTRFYHGTPLVVLARTAIPGRALQGTTSTSTVMWEVPL
jgi:RimJ/RimL family protein N-acetyltransferase